MLRPIVATVLAAIAVAVALVAFIGLVSHPGSPDPWNDLVFAVIGSVTIALGIHLAWRVRENIIGLLVVVIGALQLALVVRSAWYWVSYVDPAALPQPSPFALALQSNLAVACFVAVALVVMLFPSGHLPSRRWRGLVVALCVSAVMFVASGIVSGSRAFAPYDDLPPYVVSPTYGERVFVFAAVVIFFGLLVTCVALALLRVRRATGIERRQLQWVLLGSCLFLFFPVVCGTEVLVTGQSQNLSLAVAYLGMVSLPIGIAIGMLRYDLFDVDRAIAATVTWALVATALGIAFAAVLAVAGALLGSMSPWVAALATAACALVLVPLHRVVSRWVGARLYPARRAVLAAVDALERGVAAGTAAPEDLQRVLAEAVHDLSLRVGYVVPETGVLVDASGDPQVSQDGTWIEAAGERIGLLTAPSLAPGLRREIAAASVMLVNVVRLRLHLARSLAEVEASRARLVAAEDDARRRFERDLHDGAQQRLVSLGMTLRLAQRRLATDAVDVPAVLDAAVAEIATAIAELRRLAHGIRPSVLDEGLEAAVESLARLVPVPVTLAVALEPNVSAMPDSVATTAYYVVAESLANAVKHADAELISVRMARAAGRVSVSIEDDGCGGANAADGSGLAGLGDRVAAAGGRLRITSARGQGTTIEAELPCAS